MSGFIGKYFLFGGLLTRKQTADVYYWLAGWALSTGRVFYDYIRFKGCIG